MRGAMEREPLSQRLGALLRAQTLGAFDDNLLKGAASQAMQNLNLALGLDEHAGLEP